MFGFIKSIGSTIFGGTASADKKLAMADKAISGVGEWIDNRSYTEEEKAKDLSAAALSHLELIKATMDENGSRSITRRILAWSIAGIVLFWASIAMMFAIADPFLQMWNIGPEDKPVFFPAGLIVNNMIQISKEFWLGEAFVSIVVFYFGVWPALRGGNKKAS